MMRSPANIIEGRVSSTATVARDDGQSRYNTARHRSPLTAHGPLLTIFFLLLAGCRAAEPGVPRAGRPVPSPPALTATAVESTRRPPPSPTPIPTSLPTLRPTALPAPTPLPGPAAPVVQKRPGAKGHPTLADFWAGGAHFVLVQENTGLPMGESDTIVMSNGAFWSYLHASERSAGTVDQCGNPVPFPGCTVIYRSVDGGYTFTAGETPVCQFECAQCPCTSEADHIEQQQYPRVFYDGEMLRLVYEYLGRTMYRRSEDGRSWSRPEQIAETGVWDVWLRPCPPGEEIGDHPYIYEDYECLSGAPPGIYVDGEQVYVFVGTGQNPGGMGCYVAGLDAAGTDFRRCESNPLFEGAGAYGPDAVGPETNPYFDYRTISSADVQQLGRGEAARFYMVYEGVRGPSHINPADNQFGLGLARSLTREIDGPWETYPGNPILVDLPGNIGLGHADLVVHEGKTILYTSLDGQVRSRLDLVWKDS